MGSCDQLTSSGEGWLWLDGGWDGTCLSPDDNCSNSSSDKRSSRSKTQRCTSICRAGLSRDQIHQNPCSWASHQPGETPPIVLCPQNIAFIFAKKQSCHRDAACVASSGKHNVMRWTRRSRCAHETSLDTHSTRRPARSSLIRVCASVLFEYQLMPLLLFLRPLPPPPPAVGFNPLAFSPLHKHFVREVFFELLSQALADDGRCGFARRGKRLECGRVWSSDTCPWFRLCKDAQPTGVSLRGRTYFPATLVCILWPPAAIKAVAAGEKVHLCHCAKMPPPPAASLHKTTAWQVFTNSLSLTIVRS